MKKKCESCGRLFEAKEDFHRKCPECFSGQKPKTYSLPPELLLKSYYDSGGNLLKEVFIGVPEKLAKIFADEGLRAKQLRDFHSLVSKARSKSVLKGIASAKHLLYECQKHSAYQLEREKIPECFQNFLTHHISIAEKDEKTIEGFYQHLDSIVCYFPKEKGGT